MRGLGPCHRGFRVSCQGIPICMLQRAAQVLFHSQLPFIQGICQRPYHTSSVLPQQHWRNGLPIVLPGRIGGSDNLSCTAEAVSCNKKRPRSSQEHLVCSFDEHSLPDYYCRSGPETLRYTSRSLSPDKHNLAPAYKHTGMRFIGSSYPEQRRMLSYIRHKTLRTSLRCADLLYGNNCRNVSVYR